MSQNGSLLFSLVFIQLLLSHSVPLLFFIASFLLQQFLHEVSPILLSSRGLLYVMTKCLMSIIIYFTKDMDYMKGYFVILSGWHVDGWHHRVGKDF